MNTDYCQADLDADVELVDQTENHILSSGNEPDPEVVVDRSVEDADIVVSPERWEMAGLRLKLAGLSRSQSYVVKETVGVQASRAWGSLRSPGGPLYVHDRIDVVHQVASTDMGK